MANAILTIRGGLKDMRRRVLNMNCRRPLSGSSAQLNPTELSMSLQLQLLPKKKSLCACILDDTAQHAVCFCASDTYIYLCFQITSRATQPLGKRTVYLGDEIFLERWTCPLVKVQFIVMARSLENGAKFYKSGTLTHFFKKKKTLQSISTRSLTLPFNQCASLNTLV